MRNIGAKDIVIPGVDFHSSLLGFRQHRLEYVEVAMIRSLGIFKDCIRIELSVRCRKVPAMKIVILLLAVVGQRPALDLPTASSAVISERGEEQSVHLPTLLQNVEYLVHALVDERDSAALNSDHLI